MIPEIIFENESFAVLNKPPGWVVNDSQTTKNLSTLQKWIDENIHSDLSGKPEFRSGIVHRLDKETSGLIIIAKTEFAFSQLQKQFKERKVEKTYYALAHGKIGQGKGIIKAPVGRLSWNRQRFGVIPGGRDAITNYQLICNYQDRNSKEIYSLLELKPETGRTHQIRIHLKYLGYPIVADTFYAGRKTARHDRSWCQRLFLHAAKITFLDPISNKIVNFTSELPEDLKKPLDGLEKINI